jgi:superfamily II DNA or RNA helicase
MFELRDYQIKNAKECTEILNKYGLVYLQHTQRTGKTLTALQIAENVKASNVLFVTKKKAIESIRSDYSKVNFSFELDVTNYENLHKTLNKYDLVILDEAHSIGAFPKPSLRTKLIKEKFSNIKIVYLSGTPASESFSQWFHQFWVSKNSPFKEYVNFYKWAKDYTIPSLIYTAYGQSNDYSKAIVEKIDKEINKIIHKFTQEEANFNNTIKENIIYFPVLCENLIKKLKKDNFIKGKEEIIMADSGAKMMQKIHQLENGTIIFESMNTKILDYSKAEFIKEKFKGKKIAILYYYKTELDLLKEVFKDNYTTDLEEFNTTNKNYIGQQYSSSMGVNLSKAEALVYYNFSFSGTHFIQSRDRMTTIDRKESDIYFIFGKGSLSEKIYLTVKNKKKITLAMYNKLK